MDNILLGKKVEYESHYSTKHLVSINREARRNRYVKMYGVDVWTCYEFSFLLPNGLPQYFVIRIYNDCNSINIFESKGLKLYLNSFNNTIFSNALEALQVIEKDLSILTQSQIKIEIINEFPEDLYHKNALDIDILEENSSICDYCYDRSLLKIERINEELLDEKLTSTLLRSNCEITAQPDWARIFINYQGNRKLDRSSLLKYIVSYRNHQEFHEPTCERIYQDLYNILQPKFLLVICQYTRRGGIDINPVRCSQPLTSEIQLGKLLQQ